MKLEGDSACTLCRLHQTTSNVCILGSSSTGRVRNDVMVIGEAPGGNEEKQGKPFVGRSGALLREILEDYDLEDAFITNAVSCRPPDNRTPSKGEINRCKKWLDYQIEKVKPKFVLILGNTPMMSITGKQGITLKRGRPFEQDGIIYMPAFHPAYALREPEFEDQLRADIRSFSEIVAKGEIPREDNLNHRMVMDWDDFEELLEALIGAVSFDIETNGLYPWMEHELKKSKGVNKLVAKKAKVTMIGFGTARGEFSIPFDHPESPWSEDDIDSMVERLDERLQDCLLIAHNGKFDYLWMWVHYGVKWHELADFDTMLAHYILDENDRHGLKYLAMKLLGAPDWEIDKETKTGDGPLGKLGIYHGHDLYYTRKLRYKLGSMLKEDEGSNRVFREILMPCSRMFTEIEYDGVFLDMSKYDTAEKFLRDQFDTAERQLSKWGDINWGSTQQLSKLLFQDLGLEIIETTAAGNPSCSESVIKRLDHPCTKDLLKFREAKQQLSFFIDGWKPFIHTKRVNGEWQHFLHPSFKLHGTVTGRLSCEHPNLQQVPRDPRIRSLITAEPGWTLVECDLSQIELRIAAELANERALLHAFMNDIDVHWLTAIREIERGGGLKDLVLDTARTWKQDKSIKYAEAIEILLEMGPDAAAEIDGEWKEYRKKAKAINFGYLFGMWWRKFKDYARDNYGVVIDDDQAQASRVYFFELYRDLVDWHKRQQKFARRNGYVRSLSGRKRRLPKAQLSDDTPERREALRQSINSPVQSFANELNLMAAIQLRSEYGRDVVKICGTVHDAILMRVRNDKVSEVTRRLLEIMKGPEMLKRVFDVVLKVPVEADAKVGPWSLGVNIEKWEKANGHSAR